MPTRQESTTRKLARSNSAPDISMTSKMSKESLFVTSRRPLVPLLPKSSTWQRLPIRGYILPEKPRPCGLIQCKQRPCKVDSHHNYVAMQQQSRTAHRRGKTQDHADCTTATEGTFESMMVRTIVPPDIPFEDLQLEPVFRSLFHDFFTRIIDRMLMVVTPPTTNTALHLATLKQIRNMMYTLTLTSRAECISMIGAAYGHLAGRMSTIPDECQGLLIQSKLMNTLRLMLKNYDPRLDARNVLSIMSTLVIIDLVATSDRTVAMHAHRKAMSRVVESYGGLHNIGPMMPYVVHMDRIIAIYLRLPPLYADWTSLNVPIQRASLHPQTYGSFFDTDSRSSELDSDVNVLCKEACRAIEILEGECYAFDISAIQELTSEIHYLYFLRDRVAAKFSHLNARLSASETGSRDWCILMACRIVDYIALMDNYLITVPFRIADRLRDVIVGQGIDTFWSGLQDGFDWIIFVLACMPGHWSGLDWAFDTLYQRLMNRYGKIWPSKWQETELENLLRFVWSTTRLHDTFLALCRRLLMAKHDPSDSDPGYVIEVFLDGT